MKRSLVIIFLFPFILFSQKYDSLFVESVKERFEIQTENPFVNQVINGFGNSLENFDEASFLDAENDSTQVRLVNTHSWVGDYMLKLTGKGHSARIIFKKEGDNRRKLSHFDLLKMSKKQIRSLRKYLRYSYYSVDNKYKDFAIQDSLEFRYDIAALNLSLDIDSLVNATKKLDLFNGEAIKFGAAADGGSSSLELKSSESDYCLSISINGAINQHVERFIESLMLICLERNLIVIEKE